MYPLYVSFATFLLKENSPTEINFSFPSHGCPCPSLLLPPLVQEHPEVPLRPPAAGQYAAAVGGAKAKAVRTSVAERKPLLALQRGTYEIYNIIVLSKSATETIACFNV